MTTATATKNNAVLVVGAGIAGMGAGMHLAQLGHPVYLLDAAPAIGGSMHLLDHTFPTNSCGLCLMLPQQPAFCPTFECDGQPNLSLLPYAELLGLAGEPGAFTATVRHKARLVDPALCTGCGDCAAVCPESRPHDHEGWLQPVKAIYRPPGLRALPDAWLIDPAVCTRCGACVEACPTGAVDLEMADREERLAVGAVLLTPGFAPFDRLFFWRRLNMIPDFHRHFGFSCGLASALLPGSKDLGYSVSHRIEWCHKALRRPRYYIRIQNSNVPLPEQTDHPVTATHRKDENVRVVAGWCARGELQ